MASFNASNYQGAVTSLANRLESKNVEFTVKYKKASYTSIATQAANDTINRCILPAGCRVIPELSFIRRDGAAASTLTIDVGDSGDPDRYSDGFNAAAAGSQAFTTPAVPDGAINPYTLTANTVIVAKIATIADPAAGVELEFLIAYEDLSS
jgi:hypothetical protein